MKFILMSDEVQTSWDKVNRPDNILFSGLERIQVGEKKPGSARVWSAGQKGRNETNKE